MVTLGVGDFAMNQTVSDPRLDVPRKSVAAGLRADRGPANDCKPFAEEWKGLLCGAVERALDLAKMTKQDVSHAMEYPDQSAISKWISGVEPIQWHKLMAVDQLRPWIPVALAELASDVHVQIVLNVRRRA